MVGSLVVSVLALKQNYNNRITHISSSTDHIRCELDKTVFNFDKDVFIYAIYIPPRD